MKKRNGVAVYALEDGLGDDKSIHLAVETEQGWKALNFGVGVLFAEADFTTEEGVGETRVCKDVAVYRRENHLIGITAISYVMKRIDFLSWEIAADPKEKKEVWITKDLVHFDRLQGEKAEQECKEYADVIRAQAEAKTVIDVQGQQVKACIIDCSDAELEYLNKKLGVVYNVAVEPVEIHTPLGEVWSTLPKLNAVYSDGSTAQVPVKWNEAELSAVDFNKEGTYTVSGEAIVPEYQTPMIEGIADPYVISYQGNYYLIGTNEYKNGRDLYIRKADSIEGLVDAEKNLIFKATETGDHSGCNWAPELHVIDGRLCCLFASSLRGDWKNVQSRIMYCEGDPCKMQDWSEPVRICKADGTFLMEDGITLDMTYFEANGKSYYCWAQRTIKGEALHTSDLYIAQMDPKTPEKLLSEPVLLSRPTYAWDRQNTEVDEGPNVLKHDGKLYMTFSGDSVSNYYCLGLLVADEKEDLLNPSNWKKTGYPVLGREHVKGEDGPGHNAFTKDTYGRDVLIYHAKPNGGMRSFYARTIHYGFDGTPILYMTPEQYLAPQYRKVEAKVIVEKAAYLFVHFRETTTPDGEQVYFGLSQDGFHWEEVYGGRPLLWAYYGDMGVRDFTITRCESTGKYYIFATDLSLAYGMRGKYHHSWAEIGINGSPYLSVWESDDLLHWKEQRLVQFGGKEMGCRWAPDILHDKKNGDYIIHWSSPHEVDGYHEKAIYYSRTKDFVEYTEPALLYRKEDSGVIDSAMYEEDGKYYLFVKSEKNPCGVILLEAEEATGPFRKVEGFEESMNLENAFAYEAPTAVKLENGQWCLFCDYFGVKGKGQGYVPFIADKLAEGKFVRSDASFGFPYGFKHGTILKITQSDYEKIKTFDWSEPEDLR